ncbi:serine acetyltransferase [Defluviimonas sp. WL0002]|uniref:Serine acetyltransferase n=1 Tax=Albidovulum marisflavi TaxID=2984159 RepID=A0ABT2ZFF0_9RHOB|nr:serine acetyltransferase [Defluviimonas sp. WL0002]MCV2869491.1 serine acetyltransferase [Defluviimonas sp. WL0002]
MARNRLVAVSMRLGVSDRRLFKALRLSKRAARSDAAEGFRLNAAYFIRISGPLSPNGPMSDRCRAVSARPAKDLAQRGASLCCRRTALTPENINLKHEPSRLRAAALPGESGHFEWKLRMLNTLRADYRRHKGEGAAFVALTTYRFGRWALNLRNPVLRWFLLKVYGLTNMFVANVTKIWLPPQTTIGKDFHIIHGSGFLAVHPDVIIGDRCGVMHNVTIGMNMTGGVPQIGDDVFIGVNATILGPVKIGDRTRIGANTVVVTDVPADSVVQAPAPRIFPSLSIQSLKASRPST